MSGVAGKIFFPVTFVLIAPLGFSVLIVISRHAIEQKPESAPGERMYKKVTPLPPS